MDYLQRMDVSHLDVKLEDALELFEKPLVFETKVEGQEN